MTQDQILPSLRLPKRVDDFDSLKKELVRGRGLHEISGLFINLDGGCLWRPFKPTACMPAQAPGTHGKNLMDSLIPIH